jgi:hypothetical protein
MRPAAVCLVNEVGSGRPERSAGGKREETRAMTEDGLLIVAMAERCREVIRDSDSLDPDLPESLQPQHLLWMCDEIDTGAEAAPITRLHRWIGFVQAALLAHGMLDLVGARQMFDRIKNEHGVSSEDLLDHLDPTSSFEFDIGGEG